MGGMGLTLIMLACATTSMLISLAFFPKKLDVPA